MSHPESMRPESSNSVWALIILGANKRTLVVASSFAIDADVDNIGPTPEDLDMPAKLNAGPGFYLWEGAQNFDGLDGISYTDGKTQKLNPVEAMVWLSKHESEPPEEDRAAENLLNIPINADMA